MVSGSERLDEIESEIFVSLTKQKTILIGLMIVAAVSAGRVARKRDVSEYVAAGWSKGADGYSYDIPKTNLETVVETYYEPIGCANGGSGSYW